MVTLGSIILSLRTKGGPWKTGGPREGRRGFARARAAAQEARFPLCPPRPPCSVTFSCFPVWAPARCSRGWPGHVGRGAVNQTQDRGFPDTRRCHR